MKEKPKVLTLYAPTPLPDMNQPIEMRVRVFPYSPQAHFLVHTLSKYHELWNDKWQSYHPEKDGYTLCVKDHSKIPPTKPIARLEGNDLVTYLTKLELARMLFGFHPSKNIAAKLQELSIEDERTDQLLIQFSKLDDQFLYAYLGNTTYGKYPVIATKKEQRDSITESIPRNAFWRHKGFARLDCLWFPRFNSFTGDIKTDQLKAVKPLKNSYHKSRLTRTQMMAPIQEMLLGLDTPFLIIHGGSSYQIPFNDTNYLPPDNLDLIDCFPHEDANWKEFLERKGKFSISDDLLIEALNGKT